MCTVSNIGDYWKDHGPKKYPFLEPLKTNPGIFIDQTMMPPTRAEFDALKKEVQELKKLLEAAKIFDSKTDQHDCEMDSKIDFLKKVGELVGVDLEEVFKK